MDCPSSKSQGRWRWRALLGLCALVAGVAWLLSSGAEAPVEAAPRAQAAVPRTGVGASLGVASAALSPVGASAPEPPGPPGPAAPIIDEVLVEKSEVCSGEDNLITVRAHTPDGHDAHLHYKVGTGIGQRVPVRVWREADGSYALPEVTVFSKDNVATTVPVPAYRVKECEPARLVHVLSRRLPNAEDDFEFMARVVQRPEAPGQPPGEPFVPVRYVWTFDEGPSTTTTGSVATHTFAGGPGESALYTQHLIRVDVFDAAGQRATGRSSLQRLNTSFENFDKKGIVTVLAVGTPRFPVLDSDGVVRQTFRLYHHFRGPVRLERVTAIRAFRPGPDGLARPEHVEEGSLPVDVIPEGEGARVRLTLDTGAEPDVFAVTYVLEGTSADGHPARGTFSVMRPPPRPTRDNSLPVTDARLVAKIKRARELLRQEFVTDEDLLRLERAGHFADLRGTRRGGGEGRAR